MQFSASFPFKMIRNSMVKIRANFLNTLEVIALSRIFNVPTMYFNAISENKILAKISEFTVRMQITVKNRNLSDSFSVSQRWHFYVNFHNSNYVLRCTL